MAETVFKTAMYNNNIVKQKTYKNCNKKNARIMRQHWSEALISHKSIRSISVSTKRDHHVFKWIHNCGVIIISHALCLIMVAFILRDWNRVSNYIFSRRVLGLNYINQINKIQMNTIWMHIAHTRDGWTGES